MSFDWDAVRRDEPYTNEDLASIRTAGPSDKQIGAYLAAYKTGDEERKPCGVRHCQLIRLAVEMGHFTEAEAALERMGIE